MELFLRVEAAEPTFLRWRRWEKVPKVLAALIPVCILRLQADELLSPGETAVGLSLKSR